MSQGKILIIGAGLGGLALGQGLKQANIPFKIFERDQAASFRAQGYRIRIDENGGNSLKSLLPPTLFDTFETTSADVIPGVHWLDASTGQPASKGPSRMPPRGGSAWNVDRTVLRNVLFTGLEEYVVFNKKLEKYELDDEGVTAIFVDGSSERGATIVGADGARSRVRRQLLPDAVILDTEGRAVFGKTPIRSDTFDVVSDMITKGMSLSSIAEEPQVKLFCDMMRFKRTNGTVLPEDYIYWVLLFNKTRTDKSDQELWSFSPSQSADFAKQLTQQWHHSIRAIVEQQSIDSTATLQFLLAKPPIEPWQTNIQATLLGDAAHPMPPIGGVGANLTFQDAVDLLDVFTSGTSPERLATYEQLLRDRGNRTLLQSAGGAGHFFGMKKVEELKPVVWQT